MAVKKKWKGLEKTDIGWQGSESKGRGRNIVRTHFTFLEQGRAAKYQKAHKKNKHFVRPKPHSDFLGFTYPLKLNPLTC